MIISVSIAQGFKKMTRGKALSDDLVCVIHKLHNEGKLYCEIGATIGKSESVVRYVLSTTKLDGERVIRPKRGHGRITDKRQDQRMAILSKLHRFSSNQAIGNEFNVSRETVRRRLKEKGIFSRLAHTDVLTDSQRRMRKNWCSRMLMTNFLTWLFSDECAFELSNCSAVKRAWVHRMVGEKYVKCCVLRAPVKSRQKVHIWGCISSTGVATLRILSQTVNRHVCIETYRKKLLPMIDRLPLSWLGKVVFQQDNARPHVAVDTMQFLRENRVTTAVWPPYSPDLNPIENVWSIMKTLVRKQNPQTVPDLIKAIKYVWRETVTPQLCKNLFSSMRTRLTNVIRKKGMR
jgi:transposase